MYVTRLLFLRPVEPSLIMPHLYGMEIVYAETPAGAVVALLTNGTIHGRASSILGELRVVPHSRQRCVDSCGPAWVLW